MSKAIFKLAKQKVDDEQFTVNAHKYLMLLKQFNANLKGQIAFVIDNSEITPTKYGYNVKLTDAFDVESEESLFTDKLIEFFDDNKTIFNQMYLSEGVVNQIDRSKTAIIFIGMEMHTYKKDKDIYQSHPIKVVNVDENALN